MNVYFFAFVTCGIGSCKQNNEPLPTGVWNVPATKQMPQALQLGRCMQEVGFGGYANCTRMLNS